MTALRTGGYSQHTLRHWMAGDARWLAEPTAAHQAQRDGLLDKLRAVAGLTVASPGRSSYAFPDVRHTRSAAPSEATITRSLSP